MKNIKAEIDDTLVNIFQIQMHFISAGQTNLFHYFILPYLLFTLFNQFGLTYFEYYAIILYQKILIVPEEGWHG